MYRIVLVCHDLPASSGEQAARGVNADFAEQRDWYGTAQCEWNGSDLILRAETNCDEDGILILDYFRKSIGASVAEPLAGAGVYIESVEKFHEDA